MEKKLIIIDLPQKDFMEIHAENSEVVSCSLKEEKKKEEEKEDFLFHSHCRK